MDLYPFGADITNTIFQIKTLQLVCDHRRVWHRHFHDGQRGRCDIYASHIHLIYPCEAMCMARNQMRPGTVRIYLFKGYIL